MQRHTLDQYWNKDHFPFHIEPCTIKSGRTIEPHSHDFVELVYVSEGKAKHQYQEREFRIQAGDVFIIEPEFVHSYQVASDESPVRVYNLLFQPTLLTHELKVMMQYPSFFRFFFFEPFLRSHSEIHYYLSLPHQMKIEVLMLLKRIEDEYMGKQMGYQVRIKAQLIDLLVLLSRCYEQKERPPLREERSDEQIIDHICLYIDKHYVQDLTLMQISQLCSMSQSSFVNKFKKFTGQTMIEYRNRRRIEAAQAMMNNKNLTITEIAFEVGFSNFSHFHKLFKKLTGVSPRYFK